MTDHYFNYLKFGDEQTFQAVKEHYCQAEYIEDGDYCLDFDKIIAQPPHIKADSDKGISIGTMTTNYDNWYDWNETNWGTKWNSYPFSDLDTKIANQKFKNTIFFRTAYGGVENIVKKLSELFPDTEITYSYFSEEVGIDCNWLIIKKGVIVESRRYRDDSKEAFDFHFQFRPHQRVFYTFEEGNYHFDEDNESWNYALATGNFDILTEY